MLTFFTTAKPFQGHNRVIQRNALKSWTLLHADVEVVQRAWFLVLGITRPVRRAFGLRAGTLPRSREKV